MRLIEVVGNLFTTPGLDALGQGANGKGRMGLGIAADFRREYPEMYEEYRRRCERRELKPGDLFAWPVQGKRHRYVYNLITQPRPGPCATLPAIQLAVCKTLNHARAAGLRRVGICRVGCGLGGLDYDTEVRPVLEACAALSPVELVVVTRPEDIAPPSSRREVA